MTDVQAVLPQGTAAPKMVPGPIFAAAVDMFVAGQRLDMRSLARRIGVARLTAVIGGVLQGIGRDRPLHAFLAADPETALRILTGPRSTSHRGMAGALENLIDLERGRGAFDARLDTPTLAFAIVRVSEGFLYSDVIADRPPDLGRAVTVIEALIRGLDLVHRATVP